jgi:glycosyltransferase involved in cell wall biosynthesis
MIIIAGFIFVFTLIQLVVAIVNLLFETNLPEADNCSNDLVSVLIPARNEEDNISNILSDLMRQDYRKIEVIVFNDQSEDRTEKIVTEYTIRDHRIRLLNSEGLPDGWLGKNFACHSLSKQAKGDFLLFLDADVRISNNLIGNAVSFSEKHNTDLISIFPKQIIKTFGERITVPNMNYILVSLLPLILVRRVRYPSLAAANGQFMFFRTDLYKSQKPHLIMKNNKVEDIAIARAYKKRGEKVACFLGNETINCRMYKGFRESVNGFSKNVIAFFGNSFILASLFWLITSFGFLIVLFELPSEWFLPYLIAFLLTRIIISSISRQNILNNLIFIIPLQFSMGLFIYKAFINKYFRKFQWKGRSIN